MRMDNGPVVKGDLQRRVEVATRVVGQGTWNEGRGIIDKRGA